MRRSPRRAALLAALALAGCGGGGEEITAEPDTPARSAAAASTSIFSLAIDPGDGTMLLTTGPLLYRFDPGATTPEPVQPRMTAAQGQGPAKDLVMRFTAPGQLVGSGHALRPPLPTNLGLIRSADGGAGWTEISGIGEADYHEVELAGKRLAGLRSDSPGVRVSDDGGRTFQTRKPPVDSPPIDVAMDPADPEQMALSSLQGVFLSTNGGRSWRQRDTTPGARLTWPAKDALFSAGMDGKVRRSSDGGQTWKETGTIGAPPKELVTGPKDELYTVVEPGEIRRSSDGGATWTTVARAR